MRDLIKAYLDQSLSRRRFLQQMGMAGFSTMAARSVLHALEPLDPTTAAARRTMRPFTGTGGELLAEQLKEAGVRFVFVCNGSGVGPLCDALVDRPEMQFIVAVQEGLAVGMADGYSKASGKTPFTIFSRVGGPHASSNMYNAMKDRTPVVMASDHRDVSRRGRDGHEDLEDWLESFKQYTKWRWLITEARRIPEWTIHAFKLASTRPGGPTFIRIPRDVFYEENVNAGIFPSESFTVPMRIRPNDDLVERAARMLLDAKSPLLYVGSEVWESGSRPYVVELAERLGIPVTQARSWAADFPTTHPMFVGNYRGGVRYPRDVDLFFNLGARMPDPVKRAKGIPAGTRIIHARVESEGIGLNYPVDVALVADVKETAQALLGAIESLAAPAKLESVAQPRREKIAQMAKTMAAARKYAAEQEWDSVPISWARLGTELDNLLDADAYVVEEFGTEGPVALNWFRFADRQKTKIGRTVGRALGWGVSAAIGVKLARPNQQVVCLQGDGGILYAQTEALWTASRYDVPIIIVVFNNRCYNETRTRMFSRGGRQMETGKDMICYLGDPDVKFPQIAAAYDIRGETVTTPNEIRPAMQRAISATREGRPYLLDVVLARRGVGAESTWYPHYSVAEERIRPV